MTASSIMTALQKMGDRKRAQHSQGFFKTGPGEYAEGDVFLGIRVPVLRAEAKKYKNISLLELQKILVSDFHEARLLAVFIMVLQFPKAPCAKKQELYDLYASHTKYINNWDIVDSSAHYIVGAYLQDKDKKQIYDWAHSQDIWERRIAMIATFYYIKKNEFDDALNIAEILVHDQHDLIHKAVGWMLREIGKRNKQVEKKFLDKYSQTMPRTMLRYAIEKFPEPERKKYLSRT